MTSPPDASFVRPGLRLRAADPAPAACKVCGGVAKLFGVTDYNRSCEEARGRFLPLSGLAVYYRRCEACGLLFTDAFDDWPPADFETHIYNDSYAQVDPDFETARPDNGAKLIANTFKAQATDLRVLDYGGGNGRFAEQLRAAGFPAVEVYDPFHPDHRTRPEGRFDLVTCFETLEHMPDPKAGAADIASFLADEAMVLFSTLLQPADFAEQGMRWWYIGPRNGHVTLHSRVSLTALWLPLGLKVMSSTENLHVAFVAIPPFARRLFPQAG